MASIRNPFVDYLSRYTTASPDHEAAFDEFLAQAPPPAAGPLQLQTLVEQFLDETFRKPNPPSVILTGNAGDGKTYLCRQIVAAFHGTTQLDWDALAEQPLQRDGTTLHVVKDLSELGEAQGRHQLHGLAATLQADAPPQRYLIAANEGRLRSFLNADPQLTTLYQMVDEQLISGPDAHNPHLIVINLTRVTTSSFVPHVLNWMTHDAHWQACADCPLVATCPIRFNAQRLRDPQIVARVQLLYQLLEQLDIHVTMRDMLIHLAYTIAADQRCEELQRRRANPDFSSFTYHQTIWGRAEDTAFRRKASVVQHLERLRIGAHSLFALDDFIVSGGETDAERAVHAQIFAPAVDLHSKRFAQDRLAYLHGDADRKADDETSALLKWLPHCRRKLFFEHPEQNVPNELIPFLYLTRYLRLLAGERGVKDKLLAELVRGLNRAFSRLYLRDDDYLYVTTQYLHSGEQPRPLVRLRFPRSDLDLELTDQRNDIYDCARTQLTLVIAPPAEFRRLPINEQPAPVRWACGLLQFEYILRLAHGGTFNILAEECELAVRDLKDLLLRRFSHASERANEVAFFVAQGHQYNLRRLWLDEHGKIQG